MLWVKQSTKTKQNKTGVNSAIQLAWASMHNNYLVLLIICNISFDWLYANMCKAELLILSQKLTISVNTYVTKNIILILVDLILILVTVLFLVPLIMNIRGN